MTYETLNPTVHDDPSQFQQTYKKAYSHGLEDIYALETVDIRSVRRIQVEERPAAEEAARQVKTSIGVYDELPLGAEYVSGLDSFILEEALEALAISPNAAQGFKTAGYQSIGDVIRLTPEQMIRKGLGQGYIDELRTALDNYTKGKVLYRSLHVDFEAWLRSILPMQHKKKVAVFLEEQGLKMQAPLSFQEKAELRRVTKEMRNRWNEEVCEQARSPQQLNRFRRKRLQVVDTFVKPWMRKRGGIAKQYELLNRLERVALQTEEVQKIIATLQYLTQENDFFLKYALIEVEPGVYAADQHSASWYEEIVRLAHTYFYHPAAYYTLTELKELMLKESAARWVELDDLLIEKALCFSGKFSCRKEPCGERVVRLLPV